MNQIMKKSLSMLMALLMIVSLFAGLQISADAATVDYQYGSTTAYSNVIKNWGTRGELATFLSPNAEEFYEGTSYESLAAKAGSADITLVNTSALYVALYQLMSKAHTVKNSYGDVRYLCQFTDIEKNGSVTDKISSFYSGTPVGPDWDWNTDRTWTREHTWPDSKGGSSDTDNNTKTNESDIMMVRPVPQSENSSRGNKAYGRATTADYYYPNLSTSYDVRGDVARTVLYVYVRWGGEKAELLNSMWGSSGVIESKEVLLDWMEADPVDTWEMGRNDSVQSITGTRNVFVDYPELAFELFEEEVPEMTTPSGKASGSGGTTGCSHEDETFVVKDPTCTEQGYTDSYCADCGEYLYTEEYVPALGHSYQSVVTPPTFSAQGYTTHTCSVCGDSYVDSYTVVTDVSGWSLTLGSDLSVNFKIDVHTSISETAIIHIAVAGAKKTYAVSELTANADGFYYLSVKVAAAQMTDEITVQIVNGTEQSEKKTYSVRAYADSILAGEYSEETKTLVTQMLHYGAAAQNYFGYRTDSLADAGLTMSLTAPTTFTGPSYTGTVEGVTYSGATLVHREKIAVRFYFEVTGDVSAYSFTVNGESCTPVQKGGRYCIEIADINPQDLDDRITVKVDNALTVVYSPMNYIVNMYKKGSESLQALVKTLYNYHLAAEAYLAA